MFSWISYYHINLISICRCMNLPCIPFALRKLMRKLFHHFHTKYIFCSKCMYNGDNFCLVSMCRKPYFPIHILTRYFTKLKNSLALQECPLTQAAACRELFVPISATYCDKIFIKGKLFSIPLTRTTVKHS